MTKRIVNAATERTSRHALPSPALTWTDGHVLGNGNIGAVVWGMAGALHVGLSKHDVHDLRGVGRHGFRWTRTYPQIIRALRAGAREELMHIGGPFGVSDRFPIPISCGRLSLELLPGAQVERFAQRLDLRTAVCEVTATPSSRWCQAGGALTVRLRVQADRPLLIVELASATRRHVRWMFARQPTPWLRRPAYRRLHRVAGVVGVMSHRLYQGIAYAVAISVTGRGVRLDATSQGLHGEVEFGGAAGPALIVVALSSARDARPAPPERVAVRVALSVLGERGKMWRDHRRWWRRFWSRSDMRYSAPDIERLWRFGLYALGCSTRPDTSPPHLQGIWNQHDIPPWHADYHFNVNVQESLWAACSSNHPELQEALLRVLVHDWRRELRRFAREQFEAPGLAVPFCTDWKGRAIHGWPLAAELCCTAWAAQHVGWQWKYTGDRRRLRHEWYPFLRECALFYRHLLVRGPDGCYHLELSHSPEQEVITRRGRRLIVLGKDPTIDLALLRELFGTVVEAAETLGLRDPLLGEFRHIRDHLPPYPTRNGVLIDQAVGYFDDGDRPGWFPQCHRHPSRLVPIFPCADIGLHSDAATLRLGRRSFREFRSYGNAGFTGWSEIFQACIAARLGLGGEAEACLKRLVRHFSLPGLLTSHDSVRGAYGMRSAERVPIFQMDASLGAPAAVNEMLLQFSGGVLRLFPALPRRRDASFNTLRVPGGILVSATCHRGVVSGVEIRVERTVEVRLANPWRGVAVRVRSHRKGGALVLKGATVSWKADRGERYAVGPVK